MAGDAGIKWWGKHRCSPLKSSSRARSGLPSYAMFSVISLLAGLNFIVPLYIQIVQGRTPPDAAIAMMPFNLTVFVLAILIVRVIYPQAAASRYGRRGAWHPLA